MIEVIFKSGKVETINKRFLKSFITIHKADIIFYRTV